jgi:hypothetical protein
VQAWAPRLLAIALAALALVWGVATLPLFWQARRLEATANLIVLGDRFDTRELVAESARAKEWGNPPWVAIRRSAAIIRLRLVEDALRTGDRGSLDLRLQELKRSAVDVLEQDPADAFFWLIYYWCNVTMDGFAPPQLRFLQASYDFGPNEGWIAIRRNRLALAVYSQLSPVMKERVVSEFVGMVSSGLIVDAAANLVGPGAPIRSDLLQRLAVVPIAQRESFARYLYEIGVDAAVPGVTLPEKRFY